MNLNEAIFKAVEIKRNGGVKPIYVALSYLPNDSFNKTMRKSIELIEKLSR